VAKKSKAEYYHEQRLADQAKAAKGDRNAQGELNKINRKLGAGLAKKNASMIAKFDKSPEGKKAKSLGDKTYQMEKTGREMAAGKKDYTFRKGASLGMSDKKKGPTKVGSEPNVASGGSVKRRVGSKGSGRG
jgi:hypothetical protein